MQRDKRVRVTLSVSGETLRRIDAGRAKGTSRSAAIEALLRAWLREQDRKELEEEVRAYYARPQTADEISLSRGLAKATRRLVIDEPEMKKRRAR